MEDDSEIFLVCNWKAYLGSIESEDLAEKIAGVSRAGDSAGLNLVVLPSLPFLLNVKSRLGRTGIAIGVQNFDIDGIGAHTGSVSIENVRDMGCKYALIGHSELRYRAIEGLRENDNIIGRKLDGCLRAGIKPILCIGERAEEKNDGKTEGVLRKGIESAFSSLSEEARRSAGNVIIAYEPVWAISANMPAVPPGPSEIKEALGYIRKSVGSVIGEMGKSIKLLYGGSVDQSNMRRYLEIEGIDGFLVGRASIDAEKMESMIGIISKRKPKQI